MKKHILSFALSLACMPLLSCIPKMDPEIAAQREHTLRKFLILGTQQLRLGSPKALQQAEGYFGLASELSPRDPRVLDGLGSVAFLSKNILLAKNYFQQSFRESAGTYDRAVEHLGMIYSEDREFERAIEAYQQAIRLNPLNYRARNNLSVLLGQRAATSGEPSADLQRISAYSQLLRARSTIAPRPISIAEQGEVIEKNVLRLEANK